MKPHSQAKKPQFLSSIFFSDILRLSVDQQTNLPA